MHDTRCYFKFFFVLERVQFHTLSVGAFESQWFSDDWGRGKFVAIDVLLSIVRSIFKVCKT